MSLLLVQRSLGLYWGGVGLVHVNERYEYPIARYFCISYLPHSWIVIVSYMTLFDIAHNLVIDGE